MKAILLLALVCTITLQHAVLLKSAPENTKVTYPKNSYTVLEQYYEKYHPDFIGYGAKWVYKNGCGGWPIGDKTTFVVNFYADTTSEAYLVIAADDSFTAVLNGCETFKGQNWRTVFRFCLKNLKCGLNSLVITVQNSGANTPAALILAVTQDQTYSYVCKSPVSFYDKNTCQCKCIDRCGCSSRYIWNDYPICGCKCPKVETCCATKYFNEDCCSCVCRPVACLPGYAQDKDTCSCVRVEKESKSCTSEKTSRHEKKSKKSHESKSRKNLEKYSSKSRKEKYSAKGCPKKP